MKKKTRLVETKENVFHQLKKQKMIKETSEQMRKYN